MGNSTRLTLFAASVFVFLTAAGCGLKQAENVQKATPPTIGFIDTEQAVKAHPRYADFVRLQREYTALAARVEAVKARGLKPGDVPAGPGSLEGRAQAAEQEFSARMTAKEDAVKIQLQSEADKERQAANAQMDAYAQELDKEYQPQLFNLQLRQKTVQLTKEEAAAIDAEIAKLKDERAGKLAARQQELQAKINTAMTAKEAQSRQELNAYAATLNAELADRLKAQQSGAAGRKSDPAPSGSADGDAGALAAKQQEISSLQAFIISDIRVKAAKVAVEQKLDTVLADPKVNVKAVDITAAIIAEFKK